MTPAGLWNDSQNLLEKLPLVFRLRHIGTFSPKISVRIESDNYLVETVSEPAQLKDIFRLRYDVFFREFAGRENRFTLLPFDMDLHDFSCDHLVVKDKATGKIVATYRLMLEEEGQHRRFYTESEFHLKEFRNLPGNKLELGRACVHKDYRSGLVISLLWKGLCAYARKSSVKYMFGCSSIPRIEYESVPYIWSQLQKKNLISDLNLDVVDEYKLSAHDLNLPAEVVPTHQKMPSLLNMYLLAGAKIGNQMAYDQEMDCLDLFTVMDFANLPSSFERRFA